MPGYKIHSLAGIILILISIYFFEFNTRDYYFIISIGLFYSLLPDIDISSSKISGFLTIFAISTIIFLIFYQLHLYAVSILIFLLILRVIKHRGFIHSIRAAIIFSLPLYVIGFYFFFLGFSAYLLHLGLDGSLKW